mmetsp:Transcript_7849/g.19504  ORF Transcript_7849/g.19504 Transcript_7849/m.19504 type:complete len:164 (+) Transcript_7849:250-741(+)
MPALAEPRTAIQAASLMSRPLQLCERGLSAVERVVQDGGEVEIPGGGDQSEVWMEWRQPTLGWLQKGQWLDVPPLSSNYSSLVEYANTIRRTVVMLTFYWGAGALFPRCHVRRDGQDQNCNQALWTPTNGEAVGRASCGRKYADRGARSRRAGAALSGATTPL